MRLSLEWAQANAPGRVDAIRRQFGCALERSEVCDDALQVYRVIQDTNDVEQADRRIAAVHDLKEKQRAGRETSTGGKR